MSIILLVDSKALVVVKLAHTTYRERSLSQTRSYVSTVAPERRVESKPDKEDSVTDVARQAVGSPYCRPVAHIARSSA